MQRWFLAASAIVLALCSTQAGAQQPSKPVEPPRVAKAFDPAAVRRQAAQLAEFRALLSDPDPNVRLLMMREAIANGDPTQRDLAIQAGLASNETEMLNAALRGVLADTHQIILEFLDKDGKPVVDHGLSILRLTVDSFESDNGHIAGRLTCNDSKWSGQLQGAVISFSSESYYCSGTLSWSADTGDFRGRLNINGGQAEGNRNAIWKPR